jgi:hypothetical protein
MRTAKVFARCLGLGLGLTALGAIAAPAPVAVYGFNNTLTSSVAGAPALTVTDPHATSGFGSDVVFGSNQTVYNFVGTNDNAGQAGLSLGTTGLLTSNSVYTVEIVFKFTERQNAWRRILDVQNRQSDNGFYVDPSNNLDVFPIAGGASFTNGVYHDVFLSANNGVVKFYLDGSAQATIATNVMNVDSNNLMNFFLDNVVGGGQNEYSSGSVATIRLYDAALGDNDIPPVPGVPEPQTYALMLAGLGVVGAIARRRKQAA